MMAHDTRSYERHIKHALAEEAVVEAARRVKAAKEAVVWCKWRRLVEQVVRKQRVPTV